MDKPKQEQNVGYMGRVFSANGFPDYSDAMLSTLNGSAPHLRDVGELVFLMEQAEKMFYSLGKVDTARGILSIYSFKKDKINPVKLAQSPDLAGICIKTRDGKKMIRVSDLALALMRNLDYRMHNLEEETGRYEQRARSCINKP